MTDLPIPEAALRAYEHAVRDEQSWAATGVRPATSIEDRARAIAAPAVAAELRDLGMAMSWQGLQRAAAILFTRADELDPREENT